MPRADTAIIASDDHGAVQRVSFWVFDLLRFWGATSEQRALRVEIRGFGSHLSRFRFLILPVDEHVC